MTVSSSSRTFAIALCAAVSISALILPTVSIAQEKTMTVEELEAYIAEKKQALIKAQENKTMTDEKAAKIREELAAKQVKEGEIEKEMKELCTERNEVEPGSFDACMAQLSE